MTVRRVADVTVGEKLGPKTIPVRRDTLRAYAAASGDDNPIHQNEDFARQVGLPDVIAHGMWTMGATGTLVTEWAGDPGRIVAYGTRFTNMVVVPRTGSEIVVAGEVTDMDPGAGTATVAVTATAGGRDVLGRCTAVVRLG